jgi:crotonobetainyl-CoA:carnitine CoA-transferase CaiB-like acyl-CoA transferase
VRTGQVNDLEQVFSDPQFLHRGMKISMDHPLAGSGQVDLIGNPLKLSQTPVSYRRAPPTLGQHTDEVLREVLDMDESRLARLKDDEVI